MPFLFLSFLFLFAGLLMILGRMKSFAFAKDKSHNFGFAASENLVFDNL